MNNRGKEIGLLAVVTAISAAVYLLATANTAGIGFPLDDSWIHQTYARNLANGAGWAFIPGQPSAGLTGPLWAVLLVVGHVLQAGPYAFTFFIGWALLWALCLTAAGLMRRLLPQRSKWALAAGLLLALEWHLVWAAFSGMETILFSLLALLLLVYLTKAPEIKDHSWLGLGMLAGLSVWVRPEGITLMAALALVLVWQGKHRLRQTGWALLGFLLLFLPYLGFNHWLAGACWPNTFYAKQAEYAILRQQPLTARLIGQFGLPLIGVGIVLLPGYVHTMLEALRGRKWGLLAGGLWPMLHLTLYAVRLPVIYQHGRYAIPAMPVFFLWAWLGAVKLLRLNQQALWPRVLSRVWLTSIMVVLLLFWGLGAKAYAEDVAVINTEMVAAARWLSFNTQPDELIAAHDIGALGYFGQRPLLDLAGLVSPQVIPYIRDESQLKEFLHQQGADYLMTFPGWYPKLIQELQPVFRTEGTYSPELGGENMAVYRWGSR